MKNPAILRSRSLAVFGTALACIAVPLPGVAESPVAKNEATVIAGNTRFTILTPELIRIEYSDVGVFEDRATFTIQNREMEDVVEFQKTEDDDFLYLETDCLSLKYRKGTNPKTLPASSKNLTISVKNGDKTEVWYPGKPDPLNLKGTCRTLDGSNGDNKRVELENGLISRSGWSVIDDSWTAVRPDGSRSFALVPDSVVGYDWWTVRKDPYAMDMYFLGYGKNYKKAISDYTKIAGKIPLPPAYVFGYWYSKYASYSAEDYRQIMSDLADNEIPADVMILDMDWHWNGDSASHSDGIGGWTGWSWNTNLIPEPEKLLSDMHDRGFHISLNLHPAEGIDSHESPEYYQAMTSDLGGRYSVGNRIEWNLDYPDFTNSFFNNVIRDHEKEGVDFWWIDWQQHLTSPNTSGLGETFWCNYVFFNDMKINRPDRRPVIFHRWGGLGSHRYQIGFSGDASINFPTLAFQPYFTATSSNVGYAYWGHDLGGHVVSDENAVNDPELLLRWIQFGVFTPIFRTHASKDDRIERRIWKFPNFQDILKAVRLRYSLFPYIYTAARETYDTGIGMCRPLYYEYPDEEEAYMYEGEYFFGDDILVAPITEPTVDGAVSKKEIWFPEGNWWSVSADQLIEGPCVMTMEFAADQIPYFYREGSVIPLNPSDVRSVMDPYSAIVLDVVAGKEGKGRLYEDKGDHSDYAEIYAHTEIVHNVDDGTEEYIIMPRSGIDEDLVATRKWTINIRNAGSPEDIMLNGIRISEGGWRYDAEKRLLTVDIPEIPCSEKIELIVRYSDFSGSVKVIDRGSPSVSFDVNTSTLSADFGECCRSVVLSLYNPEGELCLNRVYSDVECIREDLSRLAGSVYICQLTADDRNHITKIFK